MAHGVVHTAITILVKLQVAQYWVLAILALECRSSMKNFLRLLSLHVYRTHFPAPLLATMGGVPYTRWFTLGNDLCNTGCTTRRANFERMSAADILYLRLFEGLETKIYQYAKNTWQVFPKRRKKLRSPQRRIPCTPCRGEAGDAQESGSIQQLGTSD